MSLGLSESRNRRRRQRRWTIIRNLLIVAIFAGTCWFFYQAGRQLALAEIDALRSQLADARSQIETLESENARLGAEAEAAIHRESETQARYKADVPTGPKAEVLALVNKRLAEGVPMERLQFVLDAVRKDRRCFGKPSSKRFIVRTPITRSGNDVASFADGAITITAAGSSATDDANRPLAWFDPAQPVRLTVAEIGGNARQVEGELPLHFSIVREGSEYLFTAEPGSRGFVTVAEQRCAFP